MVHTKKQENVTLNKEKYHSIESVPEMGEILFLTDRNFKIAVININIKKKKKKNKIRQEIKCIKK